MSITDTEPQTVEGYCSRCTHPGAWIQPGLEDGYPIVREHMEGGIYHADCYEEAKYEPSVEVFRLRLALGLALASL